MFVKILQEFQVLLKDAWKVFLKHMLDFILVFISGVCVINSTTKQNLNLKSKCFYTWNMFRFRSLYLVFPSHVVPAQAVSTEALGLFSPTRSADLVRGTTCETYLCYQKEITLKSHYQNGEVERNRLCKVSLHLEIS